MKPDRFQTSTDPKVCARVARARRFNDKLDARERRAGTGPPADCGLEVALRTVMSAIEAGLARDDWDCVAEAFCMLQDIELKVRLGPESEPLQSLREEWERYRNQLQEGGTDAAAFTPSQRAFYRGAAVVLQIMLIVDPKGPTTTNEIVSMRVESLIRRVAALARELSLVGPKERSA